MGWIISAALMYLGFYVFHGVLTNDLLKLTLPKPIFLSVAAFVYLMVAFGMSVAFKSTTLKKNIKNPYQRGLLIGTLAALFLYAVAFVVGVSFSYKVTLVNALVDIIWQTFEQNTGAFIVALTNSLFYREEEEEEVYTNYM